MITEHDSKMAAKGYRYKLTPKDATFEPLYSKTLSGIGPLQRDYPDTHFDVTKILEDYTLSFLLKKWSHKEHAVVINILKDDHPALTALFIAQGVAEQIVSRSDLNKIANSLSEDRQKLFQQ